MQHPSFPRKQLDLADWTIPNQAMVDSPARATLWSLGATRVAGKPGTGRFIFGDPSAAVFIGFANDPMPIDLSQSNIRIESMGTPFATITVVPAATGRHIADADRLLIAAVARAQNTGMQWDAGRHTVGKNWGSAPVQIEVVSAVISLPGEWKHAMALDASGKPTGKELTESLGDRTVVHLGGMPALCYEVSRQRAVWERRGIHSTFRLSRLTEVYTKMHAVSSTAQLTPGCQLWKNWYAALSV